MNARMDPKNFFAEVKRRNVYKVAISFSLCRAIDITTLEIARVLVRFNHDARFIVNVNQGIV